MAVTEDSFLRIFLEIQQLRLYSQSPVLQTFNAYFVIVLYLFDIGQFWSNCSATVHKYNIRTT